MATAVATTEKINDLLGQAAEVGKKIADLEAEQAQLMAQIRDTADAASGDYQINTAPAKPASAPAAASAQPPPKQQTPAKKKAAAKSGNGRRKKKAATAKKAPAKKKTGKKGAVKPDQRNYGQEMSLREAIWDVVDRQPAKWRKLLPDLPKDAIGLRAVEIVKIIEEEGKWSSSSANIAPQVTQHLTKFREQGKMARGDGKRYYIVAGAEIDGPDLDESGKPVE